MPDSPPFARFRTGDGSEIAVHDLGGEGEPLLMAHATGFHSLVFLEMAARLRRFHCYGLDLRAHGCSRASSGWDGGWAGFAEDVLAAVEGLGLHRPAAFGHSCGGASLLLAEESAPGTFRHLYCYEPIVPPLMDPLPPDPDNPLSRGAARRRERFASKDEALANYASKPPLSALHPAVLRAYVEHGFEDEPAGGVRLRCRPADEARIFASAAGHEGFRNLPKVRCPVDLACGELTDSFGEPVVEALAGRLAAAGGSARVTVLAGLDHFAPLGQPDLVASAVAEARAAPPGPAPAGSRAGGTPAAG